MRFIVCFIALLMMSRPAFAQQLWYEGGTLQKATVADWQQATTENQLATSADFIASLSGVSDIAKLQDQAALDEIRKKSEDLQACINDSVSKPVPPDRPVAELVVRCTILKPK
jgi:hypothetical protein